MPHRATQPYTFDRVTRMVLTALAIGGSLYLLFILKDVLLPFFIAWLLAYILNPVVRFLKRRLRIANGIAVIITLLAFFGIFIGVGVALNPLIQEEIRQINYMIANYELRSVGVDGVALSMNELVSKYVDLKELQAYLSDKSLVEIIQYISPALQQIFSNTVSLLFGVTVVFIILLYLIFILLDYDKINDFWRLLIPPKYRDVVSRISSDVERNMNTYFRHQALICLILAVLYSIGFQMIGLPMAIVFGIFVGAIHMIPYLQVVSFPPALILCWLRASQTDDTFLKMVGLTILIYIGVQIILDLFLTPRIMGKAMGLNPAIILLSLSVWGSLFGVIGMIIAIPLTTLLLSYYKEFLAKTDQFEQMQDAIVGDTSSKTEGE